MASAIELNQKMEPIDMLNTFTSPRSPAISMASDTPIAADGAILVLEFMKISGISSIDIGTVRLNDASGRDFESSALQRNVEVVPYNQFELHLPLLFR